MINKRPSLEYKHPPIENLSHELISNGRGTFKKIDLLFPYDFAQERLQEESPGDFFHTWAHPLTLSYEAESYFWRASLFVNDPSRLISIYP